MGGLAGNTNNQIVPHNSPAVITGYADHQRRRSYAVTRQLDFRPRTPDGGVDSVVDQKDYCWYQTLLESGVDVEAGDFLDLIVVPAWTRIEYGAAKIIIPKTGLVMTLTKRTNIGISPAIANVDFVAAATSPLAVNALGATAGYFFSTFVPYVPVNYLLVSLEVTAVPGTAPEDGGNLGGFFGAFQAEAVDFGQGDLNGNA
jgi:hypothetical protein